MTKVKTANLILRVNNGSIGGIPTCCLVKRYSFAFQCHVLISEVNGEGIIKTSNL